MLNLQKKVLLVIALFTLSTTMAYSAVIRGIVIDEAGIPLTGATVRLLNTRDSAYVAGAASNNKGRYNIKDIKAGKYIVQTQYLGYSDNFSNVSVNNSDITLDTIRLGASSISLGEVRVVGVKTPIKVMEDTIEYNADTYKTHPNAVVEDLLKRLPGVEVGTDGKITANGKDVSKILVDGKEFFSDDPKVASKNLPVNIVDKLQVIDRKSDLARLTGVDDGEDETVINLTVKKGMKNGYFGTVEGGYGTDDRYKGTFNINRFQDGNQITLLGNFNNINELGFTDNNGNRFRRFGKSNGITQSRTLGLNFNVGKEEIIRIGGDILWSNTDANSITRQERQYLFENNSTYSKINKATRDRGNNIRGDFRVLWKPDSFNTLEFRPNFSLNFNKSSDRETTSYFNSSMAKVSDNNALGKSNGDSYEAGGQLIYSHNFKYHRGRSFSLSGQYRFSNVIEKETSVNDFIRYLAEEDPDNTEDPSELLNQYIDNHTWSNQVMGRFTWTEPIGNADKGHFITFSYQMNYRWNNADKLVYNIPDGYDMEILPPIGVEPDPAYSNRYRNNSSDQNIRLGYRKVSSKDNMEIGMAVVPQMSKSIYLNNSDKNIDRWVWNYAPFLRYRHKFSKQRSLQMNYRGQSSQPSMKQLQPVLDISNPTNKVQGNPNLDPSFNHNLMLRFQDFNMDSQRSLMLMGNFQLTQNSIISKTTYDEYGSRLTEYVNVNGVWNGRVSAMFSQPLRNKAWQVSASTSAMYRQDIGFNNGLRNRSSSLNISVMPSIAFRPENIDLELRPRYSVQHTMNSIQVRNTGNMTVHNYGGSFSGYYYTPIGIIISTDLTYTATSGYSQGYDKNEWMWNASVSYQMLRDKSLTLSVKAYDLLQQKSNISRTISANYIDDISYNDLTRYFMFSVSYRFNTFGKGKEPSMRGRRGGGPDGEGPHRFEGERPRGMGGGRRPNNF